MNERFSDLNQLEITLLFTRTISAIMLVSD